MFEYLVSSITSRTDHPFIFSLFILAVFFAVAGVVVELTNTHGVIAGLLVIYALITAVVGIFGYFVLYSLKFAGVLRERMAA